ncbi:retrovirus-related pol polyprotein from transposon TNT 1-94, partial [Tanacetum coccineum]
MSILSKKNVLSGVHDINLKKCSHCLAGKQTRRAFKSRPSFRTENILDLVHSDFVVHEGLRTWLLLRGKQGRNLIVIRKYNGVKYIGPFERIVESMDFHHQKTPPKDMHEGLAERMNRTLVERVRCLLSHAGLPASFWGEALNTAASVHFTKDEGSKLDVKNKLVCSRRDVEFAKSNFERCEKTEKRDFPQHNDDPIDLDPVPPKHFDAQFGDDIQNDEEQNDEEHGADDVDAQEQVTTKDHHPSTRYSANEYVLLTDGGEPECYAEAMEDEHKKEWFDAMQDEMKSLLKSILLDRVLKMGSIRVVLGLAASLDLEVEQMDVKTAFLHGDLDKEIYMEQPEDWSAKKLEELPIAQLKRDLSKFFSMKDLGPAKQIIGIWIFRDRGAKKLHISQEQYIENVLCRFNMDKTKVDLAHAVGVVSRFLSNPSKKHWEAVKWIFRYLRGTSKLGITMLVGFTDSDMAGNKDNMKSTSGYLMTFAGGLFHGNLDCKCVWHCPQQRLSIWQ